MAISPLLSAVTVTGAGSATNLKSPEFTVQASGTTSAGAGAATIKVQVSNDNTNWIDLATITLVLATSSSSDGLAAFAKWEYVRANCTAISGTDATVSASLSA